ncbi:MAG TPA: hypothetical protein VGW98_05900 [Solirubrobacteraceae bacterium]|nr:hypothetical protein [Solirubrobacteraceae bacterium]
MRLIAPDVVWESSDGLVVRVLAGQDLEEARAGAGQLAEARG